VPWVAGILGAKGSRFDGVRILVWIGLAVLAIDLLLVGWMVVRIVGDSRARRRRNRFEHLGVVPLPSMLASRRPRARNALVGAAVAIAVMLGVSRVPPAPAALTDASGRIGPSATAPSVGPGGDPVAAMDGGTEASPTPTPSESVALHAGSTSPSAASTDGAGTGASSRVAAVSTSATTI